MRLRVMRCVGLVRVLLAALLIALAAGGTDARLMRPVGGATVAVPATAVTLSRTLNNPGGSSTGSVAFWMMGYPFKDGDIPSGDHIDHCALGGTTVPCALGARKIAADGSIEWGDLFVDFSAAPISGSSNATLQVYAASGSWPGGSGFSNSFYTSLTDKVALASMTNAASFTYPDTAGSGAWNANFNGDPTNTIETVADTPEGMLIEVTAAFVDNTALSVTATWLAGTETFVATNSYTVGDQILLNSSPAVGCTIATQSGTGFTCAIASNPGTVTTVTPFHRNLTAVMDYWQTKELSGSAGPTESWGPFIRNTLLHPSVSALSTLTAFSDNATFSRGGSTIRSYNGLTTPALGVGVMMRPDAQGDWTADDPGIWVSQNYTTVVSTGKVPPFAPGVSYTGGAIYANTAVSSISGAVWTVAYQTAIFNTQVDAYYPSAVEVTATTLPTGISANTVYWAVNEGTNELSLYDTLAHALANGSTGLITPSSSGSGVVLEIAEAPGTTGQFDLNMGDTGSRPDISLTTEWGAAYLVGNTQAWQRLGRIIAYDTASNPVFGIDGATGKILSLIDPGHTPTGMTAYPSDYYAPNGEYSSDINGGNSPAGGTGGWNWGGSAADHIPNSIYVPWLMEGVPFLRDLLIGQGNEALATNAYLPQRNIVVSGTTYYGSTACTVNGSVTRRNAWDTRDEIEAAMAATNGSAEETYFRNVLTSSLAECAAYESYKGANYQNNGLIYYDEQDYPPASNPIGSQQLRTFMETYLAAVLPYGVLLEGDYVGGLATQAAFVAKWLNYVYGSGSSYCPYWATAYSISTGTSNWGDPTPGTYISSLADLGISNGEGYTITFSSGNPTLALTGFPWTLAAGDELRIATYAVDGDAVQGTAPPSPFNGGTDYFVGSPNQSGLTLQLSATNGGSAITPTANASGVYTWFVPAVQSCPSSGTFVGGTSGTDVYLMYQVSGLALMDEIGISGASTAYTNAAARMSATPPTQCATEMHWCMAPF